MLEKFKNLSKFFFGIPLTVVSLYFIFSFIYSNKDEIIPQLENMNLLPFIFGIIFLLIFFLLRSLAWKSILSREGYEVETSKAIYLLTAAEIKRYIPGSVLGFISRINSFGTFGISSRKIIKMIIYESVLFLFTSIMVSIPGLIFISSRTGDFPILYYIAAFSLAIIMLLITAALVFRIFEKYSANLSVFVRKIPEFKYASLLMFAAWVFFGLGNYLLAISFVYLDPNKIFEFSSFFVLSWLVGYVVVVVPLGLGVREAAVVYGLSNIMSAGFAAVIAVLLRVGLILSELLFLIFAYMFYKFRFIEFKISWEKIVLWSSISAYAFYFSYFSTQKHLNFFTGRFDLGNMDQTVWNTLNGNIFMLTNPNGTEIISRLAVHADFILILLSPLYILWNDPRILLITQAIVISLGAYYIYKISKHLLPKAKYISLIFAVSYLLNPWIQRQTLFDFHAVSLATTFILAAAYYILTKNYKLFALFTILALLTKENLYLVAFLVFLFIYIKSKNIKWLLLSALSAYIFYALVSKLIPAARGGEHFALQFFGHFGNSVHEILFNAIFNPALTISHVVAPDTFNYLFNIFSPLGFLSFFAPIFLVFALPDFSIAIFSSNDNFTQIYYHYGSIIIPFVYIAAIFGVKNITSRKIKFINSKTVSIYLILTTLFTYYHLSVLPGGKKPAYEIFERYNHNRNEIKTFLDGIHKDLSVAATNNLGAHLSHRDYIYVLPRGYEEADVIVFLLAESTFESKTTGSLYDLEYQLRNSSEYIEMYRIGTFSAYAKIDVAHKITPSY